MTPGKKNKRSSSASSPHTKRPRTVPVEPVLSSRPTPRLKHQRLHPQAYSLYQENAQTPLLRLPREIRNQIWTTLYGNLVLHPIDGYTAKSAHRMVHPLCFSICPSSYTPRDIYNFSLQGATSDPEVSDEDKAITWAAPELKNHDFCIGRSPSSSCKHHTCDTDELKVPIVCRQMWDEMAEIVYGTCTFAFTESENFNLFLSCHRAGLKRVRRLMLTPDGLGHPHQRGKWDLKWWDLKRLKGVQSLDLWIIWGEDSYPERIELGNGEWFRKKPGELGNCWKDLQRVLKQVRRWELKPEWTRVVVDIRDCDYGWRKTEVQQPMSVVEKVELARQVRDILLEGKTEVGKGS